MIYMVGINLGEYYEKIFNCFNYFINKYFNDCTKSECEWYSLENPKMIYTYVPSGNKHTALMKEAFAYWMKVTNNRIVFKYVNSPQKR